MNPFKWFARWLLAEDLSATQLQILVQEREITRLMAMIRKDVAEEADQIGRLHLEVRDLGTSLLKHKHQIAAALEVHDKAKAPNATVKRIARILRES